MSVYFLDNSLANASDSNAGTSASAPFKTLAALNRTFQPGDTISIKAGTSYSGTLTITTDGTAAAPITFTKYGTGADPVINTNSAVGIQMNGANYVNVSNIDVFGATYSGVVVDAASAHNTISGAEIKNTGLGITLDGNNNVARDNYIHDLHLVVNTVGGDDDYGANGFFISGDGNEIFGNLIANAEGPSYDYGEDGGGFELWGTVRGLKIHDNVVQNSNSFIEMGGQSGDAVSNVSVYNNVSDGNGGFSWLHNNPGSGNFGVTLSNVQFYQNTIYEPTAGSLIGFGGPVAAGSFSFTDNLVYAPNASNVFNQTGAFHTGNFYQTARAQTGTGEVNGTIRFVNPAGDDFHVASGTQAESYGVAYGSSPQPPPTPPTPTVTPAAYSFGTGSDTLVLKVSQDAYNGGAQYTVAVDGKQIGGTLTAASIHGSGQSDTVTLKGDWSAGTHSVSVTFLNDAYGGSAATDRNLYVDSATYDGAAAGGAKLVLLSNGSASFSVSDTTAVATSTLKTWQGTTGNDTIKGGTTDDLITAGKGNDMMTGGAGRDVFAFSKGDGWDWISDFTRGSDVLKMVGMTQADVSWHATSWTGVGSGMEIDINNGANGGIFLRGITTLSLSDFAFA